MASTLNTFLQIRNLAPKKNPRMVTAVHRVAVAHPTAHRRRQDSVKQQHVRRSDTRERENRDCGNGTFEGNVGNCAEEMVEEIADSERERRLTKQRICAC